MLKLKMMGKNTLKASKKGNITLSGMMILGVVTTIMVILGNVVTNNIMIEELDWRGNSILDLREDVIIRAQAVMDHVNSAPNGKVLLNTSFEVRIGTTNYKVGAYRKQKDLFELYLAGEIIECRYKFEEMCSCREDGCNLKDNGEKLVLLLKKDGV